LKDQEKKLANQLIESLAAPFAPEKYRDEYQENVRAMIAAKLKGQEVTEVAQPHLAPVIDLMEASKRASRKNRLRLLPRRDLWRWGKSLPLERWKRLQRCRRRERRSPVKFPATPFDGPDGQIQPRRSPAHFGSHGKAAGLLGNGCASFLPEKKKGIATTTSAT